MKISIIGNGNMAKGLATRFLAGGHTVELHARDAAKGKALKDELTKNGTDTSSLTFVETGSPVGDVLVPAVHYGSEIEDVAKRYAKLAAGRIVVDITNPVDFETFELIPEPGVSGAEEIAKLFPDSHVVKAFNTVFAATLPSGKVGGAELDVYIAGSAAIPKQTVSQLVKDGGMRPIDTGPLSNARHLEGLGLIHMTAQQQVNGNWSTALKILP
jgi:predicted dinucleotide-binding enzyme